MLSKPQQVRNSLIYILSALAGNLVPLITLPLLTRALTPEDYGAWGLAQVYAIFASGVMNFGLLVGYERNFFQYRAPKQAAALLYSTLAFVFIAFAACAALTWAFRSAIARWLMGLGASGDLVFWSFCANGVVSLKTYHLTYLKNAGDAKLYAGCMLAEDLLGAAFTLLLVIGLRVGVNGLVWGPLLGSLLVLFWLSAKFLRLLPPAFSLPALADSLKLSLPLTPRILFGVIGNQIDKYVIGLLASVGGVGIYSLGQRISYLVFMYMTAIQNVFNPEVYRRMFDMQKGEGERATGRYLTPFAYLSIALALLVALFSQEAISILTPETFHGAIDITTILCMYYGLLFFGKLSGTQLIYARKTHLTSLLTIGTIGLGVIFSVPFTLAWGAIGAAWATLASGLVSGAIGFAIAQRHYNIKWEYAKLASIYLTFFGAAILVLTLRQFEASYYVLLPVKLVALGLYAFVGARLGVISAENFSLVAGMLERYGLRRPGARTTAE